MIRPLALALLLAAPAAAQDEAPPLWRLGGRYTAGSGGYVGRSGYVQAGREWKLRAGYSGYEFDGSTQTTHTGTLRASYQGEHLSFGVNGSFTPLAQEYRSRGWGADLGWLFAPGDEDEDALVDEVDVGVWWSGTRHQQTVLATRASPVQREVIVNQNDVGGAVAVTVGRATLGVDGYTALYDQDNFGAVNAVARNRPRLAAAADLVNSFPQDGQSVRLDVEATDWAVPYVAAARTSFVTLRTAASWSLSAGVALRHGLWGLDLGWERSQQAGGEDQRYLSAGGSVRF